MMSQIQTDEAANRTHTAMAMEGVILLNVALDQLRDTGAEWPLDVFESVTYSLDKHRNSLHLFVESVRAHPLRGIVSSKSLRDDASQIVNSIRFTAASARATSKEILRARISAGEFEQELDLPKPVITSGGTDFAAQKLATHVERIHARMQDIFVLVKQARKYFTLCRQLQGLPAETPHTLFVTNRGLGSGSSSATSQITGRVEPQALASASSVSLSSTRATTTLSDSGMHESWLTDATRGTS